MGTEPVFDWKPELWMGDTELSACSPTARAVWADVLCLMWKSIDRGRLVYSDGRPWSLQKIAETVRGNTIESLAALDELLLNGVASRDNAGVMFNRKMVREEKDRRSALNRKRRQRGSSENVTADVTPDVTNEQKSEGVYSLDPVTAVTGKSKKDLLSEKTVEILQVFEHYRSYHARAHLKPHSKMNEWRKISQRLRDGYSVDDLKLAIDGCHKSRWHQGDNDRNQRYDSLELVVRDASKVNQFIELASKVDGPVLSEKSRQTRNAMESYLAKRSAEGGTEPQTAG